MGEAAWSAEPDFVEYVQARQQRLLRAVYLVCGDARRAAELLEAALVDLAVNWAEVRDERPDARVRRVLYRAAVGSAAAAVAAPAHPHGEDPWSGTEPWDAEAAERRRDVREALATLTPLERAVLVLRFFDDCGERDAADALGVGPVVVRERTRDAQVRLRTVLPRVGPDAELLDLASEDLPEVDLTERAWVQARRRARTARRRAVLATGAVVAGGVALGSLVGRGGSGTAAGPARSVAPLEGALPSATVDGLRVDLGPDLAAEGFLRQLPGSAGLAIPPELTVGRAEFLPRLGAGDVAGTEASVRVVLAVRAPGGGYALVLVVPRARTPRVLLDWPELDAVPGGLGSGTPTLRLGPRTISDDRHRLVLPQPGRVVVVDVRDLSRTEIELPVEDVTEVGWAKDGVTAVARAGGESWVVDTATRRLRRAIVPAAPGWTAVAVDAGGRLVVRSFSGTGEMTEEQTLASPPVGPVGTSVSNLEGWAVGPVLLPPDLAVPLGRTQGVFAAQADGRPTPRVLAARPVSAGPWLVYRPLGWAPHDVVLLESRGLDDPGAGPRLRILAWSVIDGRMWRVSEVERPRPDTPWGFTGEFAL